MDKNLLYLASVEWYDTVTFYDFFRLNICTQIALKENLKYCLNHEKTFSGHLTEL